MIKNIKLLSGFLVLLLLLPFLVLAGSQVVKFFSQAAVIPASIYVDNNQYKGVLNRPWLGLSQGGEQEQPGTLVSLAPVGGSLKQLGVKYIRLDHVLEQPYDASLRERILEIQSAGAKPFLSLSYFPREVADSNVGVVSNWTAWQAKVRGLIELVSGRNNLNIDGVYYEVWNEPDGPSFGNFNIGQGKDYFPLYQNTVQAALSAQNVNNFKIGGPALADLRRCSNGLLFVCQTFWLDQFLNLVSKTNTRLDFISWHRYSTRMIDYNEDVNFILSLYKKHPSLPPAEKILTEWGSRPERDPVHNSLSDAAHLVSAARSFLGFVDLATKFEIRDGPDSGNQGWGILYHDGSPKPAYQSLFLLNQLRSERVGLSGEGSFVTGIGSRDPSGLALILSNYDPSWVHIESVPVKIVSLSPGRYRLTKTVLSSQYPGGKSDYSYFSSTGTYQFTETMPVNSIFFYDFQLIGLLGS